MVKHLILTILLVTIAGCAAQINHRHIDSSPQKPEFFLPPQKTSTHQPALQYAPYPLYPVDENYTVYGRYQ